MIEWKNVTFAYPGQVQGGLKNIDLSVKKGECILFCGRSGCGKTTMLRLVNGLIPNFFPGELSGAAYLDGQNCAEIPLYQLSERVGSVFQNPRTQFFNVDSDSEIAFGLENQAYSPEKMQHRVTQTAEELHIEPLLGRSIFALSGGEKQKIAFASIYATQPDVYLLDEPSSNLDMDAIVDLKEHLKRIKAQGKTILIAEHRLYYLMELADRVVYLDKGEIVCIYTPQELKNFSLEKRTAMGLRAVQLQDLSPTKVNTASAAPVLEIQDVTLQYKKQVVLEHINMQAARGEIIAVVGHNGAGKTTFSRALCGLHKDYNGRYLWDGKVIDAKSRCKHAYMVMQDVGYELFAESVEHECIFGIRNPDKDLAIKTLTDLGLGDYLKNHPNTLSGGQKQRLAVAVSIVSGKDILVFDEPTSGLDYDSMLQVAALMKKLSAGGSIIFVVTHDYELVCQVCTRVLHLDTDKMAENLQVNLENEGKIKSLFGLYKN